MPSPNKAGRTNSAKGGGLRNNSACREASRGSIPWAFICLRSSRVQELGAMENPSKGLVKVRWVKKVEAAGGFEPPNRGFADRSLNHLGMPPHASRSSGKKPCATRVPP